MSWASIIKSIQSSTKYKTIQVIVTLHGFYGVLEWIKSKKDNFDNAVEIVIDLINPNYLTNDERMKIESIISNDFPELEQCINNNIADERELIECIICNLKTKPIDYERVAHLISSLVAHLISSLKEALD